MDTRNCGVLFDLDDPKRSPIELHEAEHCQEEFIAIVAHELRNPLAAITSALEASLVAHVPAEVRELHEIMCRQVQHMQRLCDELRDIPRLLAGEQVLRRQKVDLKDLIDDALAEIKPLIESRWHTLVVSLPAQPLLVAADSSRLVQVFGNLIQNAAKYTDRKGQLCVVAAQEGGMAVVRVRDNGRGIPEHMLSAIFEMYTQVERASTPTQQGSGIGLALVKAIVEGHEGSVTVRSDGPGRGSEFTVRLPSCI